MSARIVQRDTILIPVPDTAPPANDRHVLLRNGNESIIGAVVVATFGSESEAIREGEQMLEKNPGLHFWHLRMEHSFARVTKVEARRA